jgi:hypothetical protein
LLESLTSTQQVQLQQQKHEAPHNSYSRMSISPSLKECKRRDPQLIGDVVARPAFLHAVQAAVKQPQVIFQS